MTLKVKVVQIWDNTSDKITQTDLIGDETGIIKFTIRESANLPPMEECNRQVKNGMCGEHGKVEGVYDLRTKAVLDNGIEIRELLIDAES